MTIPPTPVHRASFADLGAWAESDFGGGTWLVRRIPDAALNELETTLTAVRGESKSLADLATDEFQGRELAGFVLKGLRDPLAL